MVKEGGEWKLGFYQVYFVSAVFLLLLFSLGIAVRLWCGSGRRGGLDG